MPRHTSVLLAALTSLVGFVPIGAQSVLVDEGTFAVTVGGKEAGTEEFSIRRGGMGGEAVLIAHGVVILDTGKGATEARPLLEAVPPEGTASTYQLKISGAERVELSLALAGRRYVSRIRTDAGEEEREFLARPHTRVVDQDVAHHYYFLRDAREGARVPVIEPRTRQQFELVASAPVDEEIRVGAAQVQARRVTFTGGGEDRVVWYDRQGRVLRVEIPSRGYVAVRQDLVG